MSGINNYGGYTPSNYAGNVGNSPYSPFSNSAPQNNQQTQQSAPYYSNDAYTVDNTSKAFDDAMARLQGKPVSFSQPNQQGDFSAQGTQQPQLPSGISQEEVNWALSLEEKVKGGYNPTAEETQAYKNIAQKLSAAKANPTGNMTTQQTPSLPAGVTQEEVTWALQLEQKVKGGYQPTQQETQAYQMLSQKLAAAKAQQQQQPTMQAQNTPQTSGLPAGVSKEEIAWALDMEQKVKGGYQPTQQETQAYQALAQKLAAAKAQQQQQPTMQAQNTPQTSGLPAGVSQEEVAWALDMEQKVKGGYQPTQQDTQKYQDIAQRIMSAKQSGVSNNSAPVGQDEVNWALQLEQKVKTGGYNPTPDETAKYQDIAHRLQAQKASGTNNAAANNNRDWATWSQPFSVPRTLFETTPKIIQVPTSLRSAIPTLPTYTASNAGPALTNTSSGQAPSKAEIDWALQLEQKVKGGYNPNQSEIAQYKNISDRLQAFAKSNPQGVASNPQQQTQPQTSTGLGERVKNAWNALTK